jgi:hypothetical protein
MIEEGMPTEEDETRFYAALGRAITNWAELEDVLFRMVHVILGCTQERAAIVFFRTPTLESRLTLTSDLVDSFFSKHAPGEQPDPRIKSWKAISKQIRDQVPTRNHLAHHPVEPILEFAADESEIVIKHGSRTSSSELLRKRQDEPDIHTLEDILKHRRTVQRIANALRNFQRMHVREQPAKFAPEEPPRGPHQNPNPPA